jgi:hypothetical protein
MPRRTLGCRCRPDAVILLFLARPTSPPAASASRPLAQNLGPTSQPTVESEYDALGARRRRPDSPRPTIEGWVKRLRGAGHHPAGAAPATGWAVRRALRFAAGTAEVDGAGRLRPLDPRAAVFDGTTVTFFQWRRRPGDPAGGARLSGQRPRRRAGCRCHPGAFLFGRLDHVRLWRVARQAALRSQAWPRRPAAGLVAQWPRT